MPPPQAELPPPPPPPVPPVVVPKPPVPPVPPASVSATLPTIGLPVTDTVVGPLLSYTARPPPQVSLLPPPWPPPPPMLPEPPLPPEPPVPEVTVFEVKGLLMTITVSAAPWAAPWLWSTSRPPPQ